MHRPLILISVAVWVACLATPTSRLVAAERHALLVGCSKYVSGDIRALVGAENDVEGFRRLLTEDLQFDRVETLVGWPDNVAKRPTFANISAAFERLIGDAEPDSQIVVLMAGHGFRFPVPESQTDLLDPSNPEPDGLDEAFLAADYYAGQNMILDNQIGRWLDQFKAKGAHVWIVFDSCFSGTMTRGGGQEVTREISPADAGISVESISAAQRRARNVFPARGDGPERSDGFDVSSAKSSTGSVVAFYAAQNFEPAPEVTRPIGADASSSQFKHGLLSYHLEQILRSRKTQSSYADLGRALVSRYRADGRRRPTPFWEGDLEREVLGLSEWPEPKSLYLERIEGEVRLSGGQFAGLSMGTVVAVYEPSDKDYQRPIGHVRVTEATPTAAFVEAVAFGDYEQQPLDSFPENSLCQVVSHDFGDTQIKLRLENAVKESSVAEAIRNTAKMHGSVFQVVDDDHTEADWTLLSLNKPAAETAGRETMIPVVVLLPSTDATKLAGNHLDDAQSLDQLLVGVPHALFNQEAGADPQRIVKGLVDELQKIHAWHNVWRIAGAYSEPSVLVPRQEIHLQMRRLANSTDMSPGKPLDGSLLEPGDSVLMQVVNTGYQPYWYAVFYLNGRFGIQHVTTNAIRGRNFQDKREAQIEREVRRFTVDANSVGTNGFVIIAVSQKEHTHQPNYQFLAQSRLGMPLTRSSSDTSALTTPFEQLLLKSSAGRQEAFRSAQSPDSPQITSWSWVTAPSRSAP